jgi:hypothetical protein
LDGPCSSQDSNLASCEEQIGILCANARHAILNNNVFSKPNIYIKYNFNSDKQFLKFQKSSSDLNYMAIGVQDSNGILSANERSPLFSCKEQQHPYHAFLSGRSSHCRSGFQCCGSGMFIPDPGSGSRIRPFLSSRIPDPT